jgi:hypothetical protein
MAAHRKHPVPAEALGAWLVAARARGEPFEVAWSSALWAPSDPSVGIVFPHETVERRAWLEAFRATRSEWEAAYRGAPSRLSLALARMSLDQALLDDRSRELRPVARELVAA